MDTLLNSPSYVFWPIWIVLFLLCPVVTAFLALGPIISFAIGLIWGFPLGMLGAARFFNW